MYQMHSFHLRDPQQGDSERRAFDAIARTPGAIVVNRSGPAEGQTDYEVWYPTDGAPTWVNCPVGMGAVWVLMLAQETDAMTTTHTPGPWAILYGGMPDDEHFTIGAKVADVLVCECSNTRVPSDQVSANARLIAAAPDLLAVCEYSQAAMDTVAA